MTTNASGATPHFGLPLFEASDHPSFLTDWNGTMTELDNDLQTLKGLCETNAGAIDDWNRVVEQIRSLVTEIQTHVDGLDIAVRDIADDEAETASALDALRSVVVDLGTSVKTVLNLDLPTVIPEMQDLLEQLGSEVGTIWDEFNNHVYPRISDLEETTTAITHDLTDLTNDVRDDEANISRLNNRVGANEASISSITSKIGNVGYTSVNGHTSQSLGAGFTITNPSETEAAFGYFAAQVDGFYGHDLYYYSHGFTYSGSVVPLALGPGESVAVTVPADHTGANIILHGVKLGFGGFTITAD